MVYYFTTSDCCQGVGEGVGEVSRIPARGEQKLQNTVTIIKKKITKVTLMSAKFRTYTEYLFKEQRSRPALWNRNHHKARSAWSRSPALPLVSRQELELRQLEDLPHARVKKTIPNPCSAWSELTSCQMCLNITYSSFQWWLNPFLDELRYEWIVPPWNTVREDI